tara:strand:+ start:210 stop:953 length:744 start_codon:yes stop_codon:yes gene_type:complete
MANVLPEGIGLDVNGLIYKYTTVKNPEDDMLVHVGNLNANGDGYIFKETDDWSGVAGNTIAKSFALPNIPSGQWGNGSIDVEGTGEVKDAVVIYSYRLDKCFNPQADPSCAGYRRPVPPVIEYEIYNALEDDAVVENIDVKAEADYDEDKAKRDDEEEEEKQSRIELGLAQAENALTLTLDQGQSQIINAMNSSTNIDTYYNSKINGGIYKDTLVLNGGNLPDNKKGLRNNLAQQLLHNQLVDLQYD